MRCMPPGPLARYTLVDETVTVDGVVYDVEKIRALVLERHQLADELRLVNDTLRRRSEALNRVAKENELLRKRVRPPKPVEPSRNGW